MRHICITGASSGLGKALAEVYAEAGNVLSLWGRDGKRLTETAERCKKSGAQINIVSEDLRNHQAVWKSLHDLDEQLPIDLMILAAGVITGIAPNGEPETPEDAFRTMDVNATSSVHMATYLFDRMRGRSTGHIVFISSIAGLYPLPNSPAYSASKIAVSYYARALSAVGQRYNVRVSCVYPGYLKTPMGGRLKAIKPFSVEPEQAATLIRRRLESGSDRIVFPWVASFGLRLLSFMPKSMADWLALRLGYRVEPDKDSNTSG